MVRRFSSSSGDAPRPEGDHAEEAIEAGETPDVFLSYSRKDQQLTLRLASALEEAGWRVWVDTQDVPPASEWREELAAGIRSAHTFIFLLSPNSVASDYCRWELDQAVALGKRLVPVVIEDVASAPEALASRQYVFMREHDDFEQALETLTTTLGTDLEWVKDHRHWLMEALRWESEGRDRSLLLRGRDLRAAEAWLSRQAERTEPRPTPLQSEFLLASRAWETRRIQMVAIGVAVALGVATLLGVIALLQRNDARKQAAIARSRELALSSGAQLSVDPERSLLLAIEAVKTRRTPDAEHALRQAVFASRVRAEVPTQSKQIGALVNAVTFSPDGAHVAGGSNDGTVSVTSSRAAPGAHAVALRVPATAAANGCSAFTRGGSSQERVVFSGDGRLIGAVDNRGWVQLWRWPRPGKPVTSPFCLGRATSPTALDIATAALGGESFTPAAVAVAGDGVVQLVRPDGSLLRWPSVSRGKPTVRRLSRRPVIAASFSSSGRRIALADRAGVTLRTSSGRRVWGRVPARGVKAVLLNADGSRLAAASPHLIRVWSPGAAAAPVLLHTPERIRSIAMSRDGQFVAAGDDTHAVRVWDLSRPGPPVVLAGSQGSVTAVAFSPDGRRIASGGDDGVFRVWAWDPSRPPTLGTPAGRASRFFLSRDGGLLALDPRKSKSVWVASGGRLRALDGMIEPSGVSLSRDRRRAIAAVAPVVSGSVQLWDLPRSSSPRTLAISRHVNDVALSPDGRWIAVAERGRIRFGRWPGEHLSLLGRQPGLIEYTAVAFDRDAGRIAAAAYDGKNSTVSVWKLPSSSTERPHRLAHFSALGLVAALTFSHDQERLLAAGSDDAVRLWDLSESNAAAPIVLRGHHGPVNAAAFSSDDEEVVSGGHDGVVRVWQLAEDGKSVALRGPGGPVSDVAFRSGDTEVVAVGSRGARVWRCDFCGPVSDVLDRAERMRARALTSEERALFLHR